MNSKYFTKNAFDRFMYRYRIYAKRARNEVSYSYDHDNESLDYRYQRTAYLTPTYDININISEDDFERLVRDFEEIESDSFKYFLHMKKHLGRISFVLCIKLGIVKLENKS